MKAALTQALFVGAGGFLGTLLRYGLSGLVHRTFPLAVLPYGTLVVNLSGCLAIGVFAGMVESRQIFGSEFRAFVVIGVLGGFTTFSAFGYETFAMMRLGGPWRAATNVGLQVVLGLALVWVGHAVVASR